MAGDLWFEATFIMLLIVVNGFFAGSEIAIVSVRRSRIDQLIDQGSRSAHIVGQLKEDSDRFLATVQIGITLVASLSSAVGGVTAVSHLGPVLAASEVPLLREWGNVLAIGIVVAVISYLSLVVGELVPKSLALRYSEQIACAVARPLDFFSRIFSVLVKVLAASSRVILFATGSGAQVTESLVSEEEVKYLIREGAQKGVFDETEKEFIHGVFDFADTSVREVLSPRTEIHALEIQTPYNEALREMIGSPFSRMPVFEEDLDRIVGIVHVKDLIRAQDQQPAPLLRDLLHPAYFVPDSMQISRLLSDLQVRRAHMAVVVNEFGTVIGVVTIEDMLEEIVGEIRDEFDVDEEQPIQKIGSGVFLVEGGVPLSELKDDHGLDLEETAAFHTLAGLLLARLERIPKGGETIVEGPWRLTVVNMDGRRIATVKIEKLPTTRPTTKPPGVEQAP